MNYKMIGRILAQVLALEAVLMLPGAFICILDGETAVTLSFFCSIALIVAVSATLWLLSRDEKRGFYAREGMISVGGSWIVMSLLGSLPFYFSGQIPSYVDAVFEVVSGFTTTGASILTDVEAMSRGLLYWRSFTHWLGGMGVLVFLLVFLPSRGQNTGFTLHLLRAESPGPNVGKLVPRMKDTASILYILYIVLTLLDIFFLKIGGMPWFDSLCTAFGTAGTGGFGVKNDSIAGYSTYLQNVCTVFMLLFGVNFNCYFLIMMRRFKSVFKDEELRLYVGTVLMSIILISINVRNLYPGFLDTLRHAAFQVSSIITTTGFATTDFNLWPNFSKMILLCLMVIGACAGSTGGGLKCIRVLLFFKSMRRSIRQTVYPTKVQIIRINGQPMSEKVLQSTNIYLVAYCFVAVFSVLIIAMDGFSVETNVSAMLACFNNIGPGLALVGPTSNYSAYSDLSKIVLTFDMLAGRLEVIPILVMLSPGTWRRK